MKAMFATLLVTFGLLAMSVQAEEENRVNLAFGNTLKAEYEGGTWLIYINEDGTYTTDQVEAGTWRIDGDAFCFDANPGSSFCMLEDGVTHQYGETWNADTREGSVVKMTLIEGR